MFSITPDMENAQDTVDTGYDKLKKNADNTAYIQPVVEEIKNGSQLDFATNIGQTLLRFFGGDAGPTEQTPTGDVKATPGEAPAINPAEPPADGVDVADKNTQKALNDKQDSKAKAIPTSIAPAEKAAAVTEATAVQAEDAIGKQQEADKKKQSGPAADYPGKPSNASTSKVARGLDNLTSASYLGGVADKVLNGVLTLGLSNAGSKNTSQSSMTGGGTMRGSSRFNSSVSAVGSSATQQPSAVVQMPDITRMPQPKFLNRR